MAEQEIKFLKENETSLVRWIAISGSWRKTNKKVELDVRNVVRKIICSGYGIISGGALGVDYFATDEAIRFNPECNRIKIFLPAPFEIYQKHYHKRAREGVITEKQAKKLITQLRYIKKVSPSSLVENKVNKIVNTNTYFERNSEVIANADELVAFQVNQSEGVEDAIVKARYKGIPVRQYEYTIN